MADARALASTCGRCSVLSASVHNNSDDGAEGEKMSSDKRFNIELTLSELYAIRNALVKQGTEYDLLTRIEAQINMLHAYFDGRWHLPHGIKPDLSLWRGGND